MTTLSRGLLLGLDEGRLKARLTRPVYRELWESMAREWRHTAARVAAANGAFTYGSLGWYSISPLVIEAALLHRWGGDPEALRYLRERIAHLVAIIWPSCPPRLFPSTPMANWPWLPICVVKRWPVRNWMDSCGSSGARPSIITMGIAPCSITGRAATSRLPA